MSAKQTVTKKVTVTRAKSRTKSSSQALNKRGLNKCSKCGRFV